MYPKNMIIWCELRPIFGQALKIGAMKGVTYLVVGNVASSASLATMLSFFSVVVDNIIDLLHRKYSSWPRCGCRALTQTLAMFLAATSAASWRHGCHRLRNEKHCATCESRPPMHSKMFVSTSTRRDATKTPRLHPWRHESSLPMVFILPVSDSIRGFCTQTSPRIIRRGVIRMKTMNTLIWLCQCYCTTAYHSSVWWRHRL